MVVLDDVIIDAYCFANFFYNDYEYFHIWKKIIIFKKPVVSSYVHKNLRFIFISDSENLLAGCLHSTSSPISETSVCSFLDMGVTM